ncbi:MAG: hypothetical protein QOG68_2449, partial [Solirubrobacteraceae bacterium]|nr:hypothetical protein [Solirubrobacteraceae bacterium]
MTRAPGGPDPLELAEAALGFCTGPAQVTVTREHWLVSRFARSAPTQATDVDDTEVAMLAWHDGHTASAATNRSDDGALRETAGRARAAAEAAAASAGTAGEHPGLPEPAPSVPATNGFDPATASVDPETAGTALATTFAVTAEAGLEAFGIWTAGAVTTAIATTTGIRVSETLSDAHLKVVARNAAGRSGWAT